MLPQFEGELCRYAGTENGYFNVPKRLFYNFEQHLIRCQETLKNRNEPGQVFVPWLSLHHDTIMTLRYGVPDEIECNTCQEHMGRDICPDHPSGFWITCELFARLMADLRELSRIYTGFAHDDLFPDVTYHLVSFQFHAVAVRSTSVADLAEQFLRMEQKRNVRPIETDLIVRHHPLDSVLTDAYESHIQGPPLIYGKDLIEAYEHWYQTLSDEQDEQDDYSCDCELSDAQDDHTCDGDSEQEDYPGDCELSDAQDDYPDDCELTDEQDDDSRESDLDAAA